MVQRGTIVWTVTALRRAATTPELNLLQVPNTSRKKTVSHQGVSSTAPVPIFEWTSNESRTMLSLDGHTRLGSVRPPRRA